MTEKINLSTFLYPREMVEQAETFVAAMRTEFMPEDSDVGTMQSSHD